MTFKATKIKVPEKALWCKEPQKCHWVHFVLAVSCWAWGLSLREVCLPIEAPSKKINFSFAKLMMWTCVHFPSQWWDPCCPDLCRWCACCCSLGDYKCISPAAFTGPWFLGVFHPLWILYSLCLFRSFFLSPEGKQFYGDFPFRSQGSKFHFLHIFQLSLCIYSHQKQKLRLKGGKPFFKNMKLSSRVLFKHRKLFFRNHVPCSHLLTDICFNKFAKLDHIKKGIEISLKKSPLWMKQMPFLSLYNSTYWSITKPLDQCLYGIYELPLVKGCVYIWT